jgi:hydroxymethylglutaryl-CoA reductase (NADPH)
MDILINECANPSQRDSLINIKESLSTLHLESETVVDQKTIIHNDFNPRNVLIRTGGVPCIYDWELAVFDFPQRDILEFLSFVLPADFDDQTFWNHIKRHFKKMQDQHRSIDALSWESYLTASKVALKTFICCRVSFYEVSSIVARYDFSQRILTVSLRMLDCIEQELRKPLNA